MPTRHRHRRRPLLPLLLAAVLVVGFVGGFSAPSSHFLARTHHVSRADDVRLPLQRPSGRSRTPRSPAARRQSHQLRLSAAGPAPGLSVGNAIEEPPSTSPLPPTHYDAVVVGGGPAGLLAAIMLARQLPSLPMVDESTTSGGPPRTATGEEMKKRGPPRPPKIAVYDRLPPPPPPDSPAYAADVSRYYLLGLGHRGQRALRAFDAWNDVEKASVAVRGRRDWAPGKSGEDESNIRLADKKVVSRVLARDKLVGVLKGIIEKRYGDRVELRYGYQVDPISFGNENEAEKGEGTDPPAVVLQVSRCIPVESSGEAEECSVEDGGKPTTISTSFLIGADGAARTIANRMEENAVERQRRRGRLANISKRLFGGAYGIEVPFKVKRYEDDNPRVYKSVPISFPKHWPHDLNYSARSIDSRITFEALPSDSKGNYCALLLMRPDDPLAMAHCDPKLLRKFLNEEFPQFSKLLGDDVVRDVAKKGASALPGFRYAGPRLHEGGRTVILGDCAHTVKPYFGLGANTALEDVQILSEILSSGESHGGMPKLPAAVREFTKRRGADSKALVTISRNMDRPGKLGTARFVVPLILDSLFHKLAPKVFAPSMFGMFQKEGIGFRQIQRRKRLDRAIQSIVILSVASLVATGLRYIVRSVARVLGVSEWAIGGSLAALAGTAGVARRFAKSEDGG